MSRKLSFDNDAMLRLYNGVELIAKAVKVTLGPKGRNVLLHREFGSPHVTKDGISVAKEVTSSDPVTKMAMELVKEGANDTLENAGDGTTSTTALIYAILTQGISKLNKVRTSWLGKMWDYLYGNIGKQGSNAMDIKRGMDLASDHIITRLKEVSKPISSLDEVFNVAKISANNDESIGKLIRDAIDLVGTKGVIQSEDSPTVDSYVSSVKGLKLDRGYISVDFATDVNKTFAEYDNPYYFLYNGKLSSTQDILRAVELAITNEKPLIIMADDYDNNVLNLLLRNRLQLGAKLLALKSPGMGDQKFQLLKDLAALTGCKTLEPNISENLDSISLSHLGTSKRIKVTRSNTVIISDDRNITEVSERIELLKVEEKLCEIDSIKEKIKHRIAQLEGKLAVIFIGAPTEVELKEKKDRLDDALSATKSAIEEGIVPGAGMTLLRISELYKNNEPTKNPDINKGYLAVMEGIRSLAYSILDNAGLDSESIINTLLKDYELNDGYNPVTDSYVDLLKEGIIDPVKVTRLAVKNGVSIASMIITTGCIVYRSTDNE